jgi:cytochrome c553
MPEVVARGRKPELFACGYCHYPNGQGRPENSSLAGLSAGYIARQLYDYQSGARAGLLSPQMKEIVAKLTVEDMVSIAAYTASRTP